MFTEISEKFYVESTDDCKTNLIVLQTPHEHKIFPTNDKNRAIKVITLGKRKLLDSETCNFVKLSLKKRKITELA